MAKGIYSSGVLSLVFGMVLPLVLFIADTAFSSQHFSLFSRPFLRFHTRYLVVNDYLSPHTHTPHPLNPTKPHKMGRHARLNMKDFKFARMTFLIPFTLSCLASIALFALSIVLIWPLSQTTGTEKIAIPAVVLGPLVLGVLHILAGFYTVYVWKLRLHNIYKAVALCSYVLFHLYTYVAIGTWAGVMGNGVVCKGVAKMRGSLLAELNAVAGAAREDFGVGALMGLDAQTCDMVRWTWGVVVAAGVTHLLTAVAGYAMRDYAGVRSASKSSSRRGGY